MLRTTIYLDDDTVFALRRLADAENRSQAEIIRDTLGKYLGLRGLQITVTRYYLPIY